MRVPHIITALVVLLGATPAHAQSRAAGSSPCDLPHGSGVSSQQLMSAQRQRAYRLFVPPGYDGHQRLPLVLDLHGSGGSSAGQASNSGLESVSASERFIVATLDAVDARWNVPVQAGRPDDVAYVGDVIDHVAKQVCTDEARIYATGFSGGARMTSLLGCKLGSRIAAIAPVSGLRLPDPGQCSGRPVPVLTFHGLAGGRNPRRPAGSAFNHALRRMRGWRRGPHDSHGRPRARVDAKGSRHDGRDVAVLQEASPESIGEATHRMSSPFVLHAMHPPPLHSTDIIGPLIASAVFIVLMSFMLEPTRRTFNAILVAGVGGAYLSQRSSPSPSTVGWTSVPVASGSGASARTPESPDSGSPS